MTKNVTTITTTIILALTLAILIGTGFRKKTDVVLVNYSLSNNNMQLTFDTHITSSIGYIRGFKDIGGGVKPHYLIFYSTFGGFDSSFGAKSEFVLELDENDTEIYFNRKDGGYELVLQKDIETGEWVRPNDISIKQ